MLGLGQGDKFPQGTALRSCPLQPGRQALSCAAVRDIGPVLRRHGAQAGQQAPLRPLQAGAAPAGPQHFQPVFGEVRRQSRPVLSLQKGAQLGGGAEPGPLRPAHQAVVGGALPADGHGPDVMVQPVQGPDVFHPQVVVGSGQQFGQLRSQQPLYRPLPGGGEGGPLVYKAAQAGLVLRAVETAGGAPELVRVPALAAEGEHVHHLGGGQQPHRPPGEGLRRGRRPHRGQLQHQVRAPQQGQPGPGPLVRNGGPPALHPVAAHHRCNGAVLPQLCPGAGDLIGVSRMKGVVLRHDAGDFHSVPPCLWKRIWKKSFFFFGEKRNFFPESGCPGGGKALQ